MLGALFLLLLVVHAVCFIIVLIEMFRDEVWKGILAIFFSPYLLYYTFVDFDHEYRGWVQLGVVAPIIFIIALMVWGHPAPVPVVGN